MMMKNSHTHIWDEVAQRVRIYTFKVCVLSSPLAWFSVNYPVAKHSLTLAMEFEFS